MNKRGEPLSPPLDMDLVQNDFRIDEGIKIKTGHYDEESIVSKFPALILICMR